MLSTGRLLRATKLLCDFKTIEGTKKCSFHIYAVNNSSRLRNYVLRRKQQPVAIGFVNFASSDAAAESTANATSQAPVFTTPDISATTGGIPELSATPPELLNTVVENVGRFGGEASLQSIGLGSSSPVGLVQQALEFLHVGMDLPWWGAIAAGTLVIRICVFPLVIMSQRNAAKMNNNLPEMQAIQLKMSEARERGDRLDAARYAQEMMEFMKTKGLNPLKNMVVPLCQAPFFVSMFMGIRGMANAPVESFREGGLWWFVDLTLPDQFYLLPLITSATLALTVEVGTDMGRLNSSNMGMAKYILRAMPVIIFPFTMNFPSGVLVYWCSTNFISLFQVAILRIPTVRDYFKIDRIIKFDKKALPIKEKGFIGGMKESWTNMKITRELEERERLDNANFLRAGRGAIKKTYKFDPTQPRPPRNLSSIQLKKRD
uniref:Mitochondrial inner membrane protein OXA1L n=1 Tax=Lygus hesperus TaxID=30085 RepID=A0A0A9X4G0_LYGHE